MIQDMLSNVCDVCGLDYPEWALDHDDYGEQVCKYCSGNESENE